MASSDSAVPFPLDALRTETGAPAPTLNGEALFAFFHTDCATSELTLPFVERLSEIGAGRGLSVVAVSQDDPASTAAFRERLRVDLPTLYDPPPWRASRALGLVSVPTFVAVGKNGRVERLVVGLQRERLEAFAELAAALAGRPSQPLFRPDDDVPAIRPG